MFDRVAKRRQKNRAAASPDAEMYDYLRNEVIGRTLPLESVNISTLLFVRLRPTSWTECATCPGSFP